MKALSLDRHATNPDNGQFLPKPADVVRLLGGTNLDKATLAWTKAQQAIQSIGTYESVCFDDAIINQVLMEMGGWPALGMVTEAELPFKQREFEQRYRAYRTRGNIGTWPRELPGLIAMDHSANGREPPAPILVGDEARARLIWGSGDQKPSLTYTPLHTEGATA